MEFLAGYDSGTLFHKIDEDLEYLGFNVNQPASSCQLQTRGLKTAVFESVEHRAALVELTKP